MTVQMCHRNIQFTSHYLQGSVELPYPLCNAMVYINRHDYSSIRAAVDGNFFVN